jgi:GT2 family glycosyltransferase
MTADSYVQDKPGSPKVAIVIIHFDDVEQTLKCLDALACLQYSNYSVIVVDNSPESNQSQYLLQKFPTIISLVMDKNLGFSGGCNAGIAYALSDGVDYVWLLNNDAYCLEDSLCQLVRVAEETQDAGVIGGVLLEQNKGHLKQAGMGYIDYRRAKIFTREPHSMESESCDWVCGGNMLLSAPALARYGAFDDAYFLYKEDVELCVRLTRGGYKCVYVPSSKVYHEGSVSTSGQRTIWRYYYGARNRMLFFSQHTSRPVFIMCLMVFILQLIRHLIFYPIANDKKKVKTRGEYLGFWDFIRGKFGQRRFS